MKLNKIVMGVAEGGAVKVQFGKCNLIGLFATLLKL
jgi:hypothetical protein